MIAEAANLKARIWDRWWRQRTWTCDFVGWGTGCEATSTTSLKPQLEDQAESRLTSGTYKRLSRPAWGPGRQHWTARKRTCYSVKDAVVKAGSQKDANASSSSRKYQNTKTQNLKNNAVGVGKGGRHIGASDWYMAITRSESWWTIYCIEVEFQMIEKHLLP